MKKQTIYAFILTMLSFFTEVQSQLIKAYTPYNGYVSCLSAINSKIYAGSKGTLFVSSNSGENWISIKLTEENTTISGVVGNGQNIFAGTCGQGIYKSTDNGNSWEAANSGLTNHHIISLAIKDSLIFAGSSGNGIFRSTNYGATWSSANSGITNDTISALITYDSTVIAGSSIGGIFLSRDKGNQWSSVTISNRNPISSFVKKGQKIFASFSGGGVYVSQDGGQQWSASSNGLYNSAVTSLVTNGSLLYASTYWSGVFRSIDDGSTWSVVINGLTDSLVTSLALSDTCVFAGTEQGGVFRLTDNENSWSAMNNGLISANIITLMAHGSDVFAGTNGGGVLLSTDGGKSWTTRNSGIVGMGIQSLAMQDSIIYASTWDDWVYKSSDYGKSWIQTTPIFGNSKNLAISDSIVYVISDQNCIYKTIDHGNSWQKLGLNGNLDYIAAKDSFVIASSYPPAAVYLSTNFGKDWTSIGSPVNDVVKLGWCGDNIVAGTGYGFYIKAKNGGSWIRKIPKTSNPFSVLSMAIKDSVIVIGTVEGTGRPSGLYLSTDCGENWISIASGLYGWIYALAIVGTDIFVGDNGPNLWKGSLSEMVTEVGKIKNNVVFEFFLEQNFPNPFNPTTTISFTLPFKSFVSLKIYDIIGREVEILVNEKKNAGVYTVTFNANNLSSGVYFYRLQAGTFTETKKFIVLR